MERDNTTDQWLDAIARLAVAPRARPDEALATAVTTRLVDTIGCALGAGDDEAPRVSASYAARRSVGARHSVWGTRVLSDVEGAAFANGVAARYLDFNDAYYGVEPIHPSDVIPTLFATSLERGTGSAQFLDAVTVAYEVAMESADLIAPRLSGFDHVNLTMLGAVAGVARLLELNEEQARHGLSIAVTSHAALRQGRHGELSMWKAFAAADACRHALYAGTLASLGARGPAAPFAGDNAFFQRALGLAPHEVPDFGLLQRDGESRVARSQIKMFPCGFVGQSAGQAALDLVERGVRLDEIASIELRLDPQAASLMLSPEKLEPRTRETADHSIPYVVVSTLKRGFLDVESFSAEAISDDEVRRFMRDHLAVDGDPAIGAGYDSGFPVRLMLRMKDGTVERHEVRHPPGSPGNPMTRDQLRAKFQVCVARSALADRTDDIWDAAWAVGSAADGLVDLDRLLRL